jgi:hypothetical protein
MAIACRDMRLPFRSMKIALRCRSKVAGVQASVSGNRGDGLDHSTSCLGATPRAFDENNLLVAFEFMILPCSEIQFDIIKG